MNLFCLARIFSPRNNYAPHKRTRVRTSLAYMTVSSSLMNYTDVI